MKYRKKPVVVEAIRVNRMLLSEPSLWPEWLTEAWDQGVITPGEPVLQIRTLEGTMGASPDDYIIRGVKGELYPCRADIFEMSYEPVEET